MNGTSFTQEQKAFIREVALEVVPVALKAHVDSCPWGKKMTKFIWIGVGMGIALSILGITTISELGKWIGR